MTNERAKEEFCGWKTCADELSDIWLQSLFVGANGLILRLGRPASESPIVTITFESTIAVRTCGESYRFLFPKFPDDGHLVFVVANSTFVDWIVSESADAWDSSYWTHYLIITPEVYVDVVSKRPPAVEMHPEGA